MKHHEGKHHHKHGGRVVKSPHSPQHDPEIETPFHEHGLDDHGPFHGSHPDHYEPHHGHGGFIHKHRHGK